MCNACNTVPVSEDTVKHWIYEERQLICTDGQTASMCMHFSFITISHPWFCSYIRVEKSLFQVVTTLLQFQVSANMCLMCLYFTIITTQGEFGIVQYSSADISLSREAFQVIH